MVVSSIFLFGGFFFCLLLLFYWICEHKKRQIVSASVIPAQITLCMKGDVLTGFFFVLVLSEL